MEMHIRRYLVDSLVCHAITFDIQNDHVAQRHYVVFFMRVLLN